MARRRTATAPPVEMTTEEASRLFTEARVTALMAAGMHLENPPYHPRPASAAQWYPFGFELRLGTPDGTWRYWWDYETRAEAEAAWPALQAEWPHCPVSELVDWRSGEAVVLATRDLRETTMPPASKAEGTNAA